MIVSEANITILVLLRKLCVIYFQLTIVHQGETVYLNNAANVFFQLYLEKQK